MAVEYSPTSDHYLALGVGSTASHDEIRRAHRALIRELHPDRGGESLSAAQVNIARDILLDPLTRLEYDEARHEWHERNPLLSAFTDAGQQLLSEKILHGGSVDGDLHDPIVRHFDPDVRHFCLALSGNWLLPCLSRRCQPLETSRMTKGPEKRDRKLSIRLSSATLERLRVVAKFDHRAMSDWALLAVEEAITRAEARHARARNRTRPE